MPSRRFRTLPAFSGLLLMVFTSAVLHAQKTVFAHYLVTNQDYQADDSTGEAKISAYEKEIQQAQAIGIDGFALDAGGWINQNYYVRYASEIFEAAYRLNSGFKLMFSADMCCGNGINDVEDMMRRFANNGRYSGVYYKRNGAFVLSTFSGQDLGPAFWSQIKNDLTTGANPDTYNNTNALSTATGVPSSAAMPLFLLPAFFWGGETPTTSAIQSGLSQYQNIIDGSFYWGIAGVPGQGSSPDQIPSSESYAGVLHGAGKQYMAPVTIQFWGANANRYYEYSGYSGMRKMWLDAINVSHPDLIEIITWNDFIEGSYVSPIDDPNKYPNANFLTASNVPTSTLGYFHSHTGATDFLQHYIQWYKTGVEPAVASDQVYWAYRTQSQNTNATTNTPTISTKYGPVSDSIYISAELTAPAQLSVTAGGSPVVLNLQAGYNEQAVPFIPGNNKPSFNLQRNGTPVVPGSGTDAIQTSPQYNDYYYSTGDMVGGPPTFPAATASSSVTMGSSPSLAAFNGKLYAAFRSNDSRNILFITSSSDGLNFPAAAPYPSIAMGSAPALAVFNNRLYVAFQANDPSHDLFIASSSDGVNFAAAKGSPGIQIGGTPSLAAFNNQLYVAFQANDSSHNLWLGNSSDGVNFATTPYAANQVGSTPALAVFNNSLYIAFQANDSRNILFVTSSPSGSNFPPATAYGNIAMGTAPSLAVSKGVLYITFQSNDSRHLLTTTTSSTGSNCPSATVSPSVAIGGAPSAAAFGTGISVSFQANDPSNTLWTTHQ